MSNVVLIIGDTGTGKSTSIRNLNPKETFIISVTGKGLPFKGWRNQYELCNAENPKGNYFVSQNSDSICRLIGRIDKNRPEIINIVIDDWQYLMGYEFMARASEKSYEKFTEIGMHAFNVLKKLEDTRSDIISFVLAHEDREDYGKRKCKTIGKMLDEKIKVEGMMSIVLFTESNENGYRFSTTNQNGLTTGKTPDGMFDEVLINNDLQYVRNNIIKYEMEDINDGI